LDHDLRVAVSSSRRGRRSRLALLLLISISCGGQAASVNDGAQPPDGAGTMTANDGGQPPDGAGGATTCPSSPPGATSTLEMPRRTVSWTVVAAAAGGGAGDGGIPASGCDDDQRNWRIHCRGTARVRTAGAEPELVLGDGSVLRWASAMAAVPVAPPRVAAGDSVWVEYRRVVQSVCPFCGSFTNTEMVLRRNETGEVLWIARDGHRQQDIDVALAQELFGVSFRAQAACNWSFTAGCFTAQRTQHDHVLLTTPERLLPHGRLERVSTPKGAYEVVWAHSTETNGAVPGCADGPGPASDTAFAASRLAP
jgi:hypothetical protein